jgi:hypothetical protein
MSTTIAEVQDVEQVRSADFVKLTIATTSTSTVYTFSTSYKHETIEGVDYTPLGGLVAVGQQQRDLKVTGFDTAVTLVGVDPANINLVLATPLRGSTIVLHRGFYNSNHIISTAYKRFTGIVTGYNISEEREGDNDTFTVSISCSSYKTVLENNIGGRRTNRDTWSYLYGNTDTSMDSVERLNGAYFDFGVPVK